MSMPPGINKLERLTTKGLAKAHRIVTHYGKSAASLRSIQRKGCNDDIPSDFQGSLQARNICSTVTFLSEEVEGRPIMPNIVSRQRLP